MTKSTQNEQKTVVRVERVFVFANNVAQTLQKVANEFVYVWRDGDPGIESVTYNDMLSVEHDSASGWRVKNRHVFAVVNHIRRCWIFITETRLRKNFRLVIVS